MKKAIYFTLITLGCSFVSCENEIQLADNDYIVFGHFYGECFGEGCVEIFRLEKDRLLEDTNDKYPGATNFYSGNFIQLSEAQFDSVKDIVRYFPETLLNETDTVIGMPDAGDWGGLYVEYCYNGVHKFWLIDQMKSNVPVKYHEFIDKVNEKIDFLQPKE